MAPRARVVAGLIAVLAAVAAGAGPAVDAGSAGRSSPNDELLLYHAKFTVLYEVEWHTKSGSPGQECSRWYDDRGTSKVVIEDAAWVQRKTKRRLTRADGIPGSLTVSGRWRKNGKGLWATGSAVGRAKATAHRTWIQRGGVNWTEECGGTRPESFKPEPDDCGKRTFATRTATFIPQSRRRFDTLKDVQSTTPGSRPALAFSMPGPAPLYRACEASFGAPDLPVFFAFWLGKTDIRNLTPPVSDKVPQIHSESSGDCTDAIDPDESCTFHLELTLDVQPWEPGTPFP